LTPEITELLTAVPARVVSVELTYPNGGMVKGSIKRLRSRSLKVILLKENPAPGESPRHRVRFDHVDSMKLTLDDGTLRKF